jgi:hypothetical protein
MRRKIFFIIGITFLGIVISCTKLDETTYSLVPTKDYKVTAADIGINYVSPAYQELHQLIGHNDQTNPGDPIEEQEYCTDEDLIPTRGGDWYDGGHFQRLFEHTWTSSLADFNTCWMYGFGRVGTANQNIHTINQKFPSSNPAFAVVTAPLIAQLKMVRALGYYYLIDFFGNVPIVTKYDSTHAPVYNNPDFQAGRTNLFDTIVNDINNSIPLLSSAVDASTYGIFNKWGAYALLAKMYINAEVWAGTPMYNECIEACDSIINSKSYSLELNYFTNFMQANQGSKENILVIPYSPSSTEQQECFYLEGWHYSEQAHYKTVAAPWNGMCAMPDFYRSFDSTDIRRNGWTVGARFAADGITPLLCIRETAGKPLNYTADFIDLYNPGTTHDYKTALEYNGARLSKFQIQQGMVNWCMGVPFPLFRYADILMLKAEAEMRLNGGNATSDAVALVNQIRGRAGVALYTTSTLTMDALLAERSKEFYHEGFRRQDLVRFGKFVRGTWASAWYDRSGESDTKNVYPIPQNQISAQPGLIQNPGY